MKLALSRKVGLTAGIVLLALILLWAFTASAQTTVFTQQMSVGSRGAQVSELQSFLATKTSHYPEGLVTGYFGVLTQAAVQRFQCAEEIVCSGTPLSTGYGRVGPMTLVQLNLRAGGSVGAGIDFSGPFIFATAVATSPNAATVNFSTNEPASSKVYYSSLPITFSEAAGLGFAPIVTGTGVTTDTSLRSAHSVMLSGLASSTTYFYVVQATDASGNLSLTWPATFRTNP
ncbi:fibronectin type III domain-containing protein [Candidatus Kaiserbacteria bacterium]|nr:fibronectin type III domain-containing protein [Candidatus Kaiserbacteria bacterium]